ncbi:hypothetical protein E4U02_03710 [Microbacterium paludicola]|uniref:Glycosyltransferase RgtA/B/C/D-like domain-containing protein n=1 Tax=Microbacterium paludicola TaxID=300019 RepID=A0A4Y9FZ02_9MICO|nr:hypothetical protein [Microbacterium paludicola]MBF0815514.1 hypothetical protein [Microbacterium paludicola]TFU33782.1 hypothetical protein E4U02_03710 [Microbacterium paludicola]
MAHDALTQQAEGAGTVWRSWPVALRILVVYVVARLATTAIMLAVAANSPVDSRFGADPDLADYVLGWDAQWYWTVAFSGYPSELPLDEAGTATENAWAFMPVYAHLANILGFGTWGVGALIVSLLGGYVACLALHALLRRRIGEGAATWAVVLFANAPLAALFQVGYAEALFLAFLMCALLALSARRWWWLYLLIPLMGYTRPGVLAFALLLGLYGIFRWFRRRDDPLPAREVIHIVVLGALAVAVGFSWQLFAALATGVPDAYLETELAWRRGWIPGIEAFVPFEGWIRAAPFWFSLWGLPEWLGIVALVVLVLGAAAALFSAPARRLGPEVRLWSASYILYLLAVFFPQSSTFRLLVPLSPLWGAAPRSRVGRGLALVLCLAGQWWWIATMYGSGNTYWQVP